MVGFFVGGIVDEEFEGDPWRIWGHLDLVKSSGGKQEDDDWIVEGAILNAVEDVSGEMPILKGFDWSYFDRSGYIKYEHDPRNKAGRPVPTPTNIIGVPHQRIEKSDSVLLRGALLPEQPMAQETKQLIKALRKHNERFPKHKRTLGFSIEGNYLSRKIIKSIGYTGKPHNVVVTPNPQDFTTYAEMVRENNRQFAKSLQATPVDTDVAKRTGGAVITKETIDKKVKKYLDFKDEREAYDFFYKLYRDQKQKPVEASKKAREAAQAYTQGKQS